MTTESQRKAIREYKGRIERIDLALLDVSKAEIAAHLEFMREKTGEEKPESRNHFINRAIVAQIDRDRSE